MSTARSLSLLTVFLAACGGGSGVTATAPPPVSIATDDFQRTTVGPNWWVNKGEAAIIGGSAFGVATTIQVIAGYQASFASDQFSEAVVVAGFNRLDRLQVCVRMNSSTNERYALLFRPDSALYQLKFDGAEPGVVLASVAATGPGPGDILRIEARGTSLRGLVNGVVVLEATNGALTSGSPGVSMRAISGVAPAAFWESWRGGALP